MSPEDLKIETVPHVKPGGQYVGCVIPQIKVTHLPSGNFVWPSPTTACCAS